MVIPSSVTPTETPTAKEAIPAQASFDQNITKIEGIISFNFPDGAETISSILDDTFLKELEKNTGNYADLLVLINILFQEKKSSLSSQDIATLETLQIFLNYKQDLDIIIKEGITYETFTKNTNILRTNGNIEVPYNTKDLKGFLSLAKNDTKPYKELPSQANIKAILNNPTLENVQSLQQFLFDYLPDGDIKTDLEKSSKRGDVRDGKFGEKTYVALTTYLANWITYQNYDESKKKVDNYLASSRKVEVEEGNIITTTSTTTETKAQNQINELQVLSQNNNFQDLPKRIQRRINDIISLGEKNENTRETEEELSKKKKDLEKEKKDLETKNNQLEIEIASLDKQIQDTKQFNTKAGRKIKKELKEQKKTLQKQWTENTYAIEGRFRIPFGFSNEDSDDYTLFRFNLRGKNKGLDLNTQIAYLDTRINALNEKGIKQYDRLTSKSQKIYDLLETEKTAIEGDIDLATTQIDTYPTTTANLQTLKTQREKDLQNIIALQKTIKKDLLLTEQIVEEAITTVVDDQPKSTDNQPIPDNVVNTTEKDNTLT